MLRTLSIRDFVLIDKLDLNLEKGLSIFSGETGAGKSILLYAIGLTLGDRGKTSFVRVGSDKSVITAEFLLPQDHEANRLIDESGIDTFDSLIIRRILYKDGKSKAFINDNPVNIGLVKEIGKLLIEIHGQFDRLLDPASHRDFVDQFAQLDEDKKQVAEQYRNWQNLITEKDDLIRQSQLTDQNRDYLNSCLEELEKISPQVGEDDELERTKSILINQTKIIDAINEIDGILNEGDGLHSKLVRSSKNISKLHELAIASVTPIVDTLDRVLDNCNELQEHISATINSMRISDHDIDSVEERLFILKSLARKHSCLISQLPEIHEALATKLSNLKNIDHKIKESEALIQAAKQQFAQAADILTQKRIAKSKTIVELAMQELPALKLEKVRFEIQILPLHESSWNSNGKDDVRFRISTNPGNPFGDLAEIASGGERSRLMLALKVILAQTSEIPTLIFDEIDSGAGGSVAKAIGERLLLLGQNLQVLSVTHSPQVTSAGQHNWRVEKLQAADHTTTKVTKLNGQEKTEEIARMLSGNVVTDEARAAAEKLLLSA